MEFIGQIMKCIDGGRVSEWGQRQQGCLTRRRVERDQHAKFSWMDGWMQLSSIFWVRVSVCGLESVFFLGVESLKY